jgi:sugar lactone lactonase YvrE
LSFLADGDLLLSMANPRSQVLRFDPTTLSLEVFAGTGGIGFAGDDGPALDATLNDPACAVPDAEGNVYICDNGNNRIRRVDTAGRITTFVGGAGELSHPNHVAFDSRGDMFITDTNNNRILRRSRASGELTVVAGTGGLGFSGDGGPAGAAELAQPLYMALTAAGDIFFSDSLNNRVRRIDGTRRVAIDIKPGSYPNAINLGSAGVVPVAILGGADFDTSQIVPSSVSLAGARVKRIGNGERYSCAPELVDGDPYPDLVCHVITAQLLIEPGDTSAVLEAETVSGERIRGEDSVRIVPR